MNRKLYLPSGMVLLALPVVVLAQPAQLRTGASTAVDGYLEVRPDEYGSWQTFSGTVTPNGDQYNAAGAFTLQPVAFTSGFFLFVPGVGREVLSDSADWQTTVNGGADTSLTRMVTVPNVASDTNGDGINDTATSGFTVSNAPSGEGLFLNFALTQHVGTAGGAVSFMQQTYTMTNNGIGPATVDLVRVLDADLYFSGGSTNFTNDQVGTTANGAGLGQFVAQRDPNQDATGVTLSGVDAVHYFGGKQGHTPTGGPPAFGFGTDVQVWDANGMPTSWQNYIAFVGYNTNGFTAAQTGDGFIGLDFLFELGVGESATFDVFYTYGQTTPVPEPATLGLLALAGLALVRRRSR